MTPIERTPQGPTLPESANFASGKNQQEYIIILTMCYQSEGSTDSFVSVLADGSRLVS